MNTTHPTYFTVFENVFCKSAPISHHPVSIPCGRYRATLAAALAIGIIGLTTAAGALTRQHRHADFTAAMQSATYVKVPTIGGVEVALY